MVTALFGPRRLQTREARKQLTRRQEPYWHEIRRGLAIGYRQGTEGTSWLLREFRRGRYTKRRIGAADDELPADGATVLSWSQALNLALGSDRPTITKPGHFLVRDAASAYFEIRGKRSSVDQDRQTFEAMIEPKFGNRPIAELETEELERWLADQVKEAKDKDIRRAQQATANRRFTILRAILNAAYRRDPARVPSADAWRRVQPFPKVDQPRTRTISAAEARRLLNALPTAVRALARGALYTGCRVGELLEMTVAHVEDAGIHVQHSKSGRSRRIPLGGEGRDFFEQLTAGRAGDELLFQRGEAVPWSRVYLSRTMQAACAVAKIAPHATFHDLRRSYGSLLLNSGASADVIQELLGHADLRMTRRAYAHLLDKTKQKAVDKHLPSFGLERSNVRKLKVRGT